METALNMCIAILVLVTISMMTLLGVVLEIPAYINNFVTRIKIVYYKSKFIKVGNKLKITRINSNPYQEDTYNYYEIKDIKGDYMKVIHYDTFMTLTEDIYYFVDLYLLPTGIEKRKVEIVNHI